MNTRQWPRLVVMSALLIMLASACQQQAPSVSPTPVPPSATTAPAAQAQTVHLVARCKAAPGVEDGRCNNLVTATKATNEDLAAANDARRIEVEIIQDNKDWGPYKTEFELASQAGKAPDIIVAGHEYIGDWAPAGYLVDLTDQTAKYSEFKDIIDSLWNSTKLNGRVYGIPQDVEARPMFYSKPLLRKLGWSDADIDSLPERVASGKFTTEDMFDAATQAVQKGVVKPGNGWWHRPVNGTDFLYYYYGAGGEIVGQNNTLIFDKAAALKAYQLFADAAQKRKILPSTIIGGAWNDWNAAVSSADQVLFWYGGSWQWNDWALNFVKDRGGLDFMEKNVGFSAIPAQKQGTNKPITLSHPLLYMISKASKNPDLALLLISKVTVPSLNTEYAVASSHLGILKSQATYPAYTSAKFLNQVLPLLQFTTFAPNSPSWSAWSDAYFEGIKGVESGDLTPDKAVDLVVGRLQQQQGKIVIR